MLAASLDTRSVSLARQTIVEDDVVGVVYRPRGAERGYAVVLGGSGGGIPEPFARRVASTGFVAFGVAYFGLHGLPGSLVSVELTRVARAIELFRRRFRLTSAPGLVGSSKGAELALCLAAHAGELVGPVVAASPSSVSWYGLDGYGRPAIDRPSWTWQGSPVPFLPYRTAARPTYAPATGMRVDDCYHVAAYPRESVERASLRAELAAGPILLLAGQDDHMWPSAPMAAAVLARMRAAGRADDVKCVTYPNAGHVFLHHRPGPPARSAPPTVDFGGTRAGDEHACRDGWARIGTFLADH